MRCQEGPKWKAQGEWEVYRKEESANWCPSGKAGHEQEGDEEDTKVWEKAISLGERRYLLSGS